jgi:predicted secreted protein
MARKNGRFIIVKWNGTQIPGQISGDITIDKNVIDVTDKDSNGWFTGLETGDKNWSITAELHWDAAVSGGAPQLITDIIAGTNATVYFGGTTSGEKYYSGTGILQNVSISAANNEAATVSVTIQGTGALTETTI